MREHVLVLHIPALDLRHLSPRVTPRMARLMADSPWLPIRTLPYVDHVPTMFTGVLPHQHGMWGARLRTRASEGRRRLVDRLPDAITTFAQGSLHVLRGPFDLAAMPPRRRRRFELKRYKFIKYGKGPGVLEQIGGFETIFTRVGASNAAYRYVGRMDQLPPILAQFGSGSRRLEFIELHALDIFMHWHHDRPDQVAAIYSELDGFVGAMEEKCRNHGTRFLLMSDHGQERVRKRVDLPSGLARLGLGTDEVDYCIESTRATFWAHTDRARDRLIDWLHGERSGTLLSYRELTRFGLHFDGPDYGDFYFFAAPGTTLFPNEFTHRAFGAVLGITHPHQRPRILNGAHRGDHAYLPDSPSEQGFMLLARAATTPAAAGTLLDVAPTILTLSGVAPGASMHGTPVFRLGTNPPVSHGAA